jgi:hypothetical protein
VAWDLLSDGIIYLIAGIGAQEAVRNIKFTVTNPKSHIVSVRLYKINLPAYKNTLTFEVCTRFFEKNFIYDHTNYQHRT